MTNSVDGGPVVAAHGRRVSVWVVAAFALFFVRALLFATWVSRGPEVKKLLGVNDAQLGLITMAYALGGLLAISFASRLVHRYGSRRIAFIHYAVAASALALLGPAISGDHLGATVLLLVVFGAPISIVDFVGNYEGTLADKAARRSVLSVIHGAYGVGMLSAAALTGVVSDLGVSLSAQFVAVAAVSVVISTAASLCLPRHRCVPHSSAQPEHSTRQVRATWTERRNQLIALIGFSFIMAELAAGAWLPIALTTSGFSDARAAYALSLFWILVTVGRLLGDFVVDALGRYRTVLYSAITTAVGLLCFTISGAASIPVLSYVAIVIWGVGTAIGFPMTTSAMSDDPRRAADRLNMLITIVYVSGLTVGPSMGSAGEIFGIYPAFLIPVALMLMSAWFSGVVKPEEARRTVERGDYDDTDFIGAAGVVVEGVNDVTE